MVYPQVYRSALIRDGALQEIKQGSGLLYDSEAVVASVVVIERNKVSFNPGDHVETFLLVDS